MKYKPPLISKRNEEPQLFIFDVQVMLILSNAVVSRMCISFHSQAFVAAQYYISYLSFAISFHLFVLMILIYQASFSQKVF